MESEPPHRRKFRSGTVIGLGIAGGLGVLGTIILMSAAFMGPWYTPIDELTDLTEASVRNRLGNPSAAVGFSANDLPPAAAAAMATRFGDDDSRPIRELHWTRAPGVTVWFHKADDGTWRAFGGSVGD